MNLKECKDYVENFLDANCKETDFHKKIEWLKTYNFSKLAKEEKVDEDATKLAKAIYFIIWYDELPLLKSWENMEEYYGGETINTFNSLFQSDFLGITDYVPLNKENAEFYVKVIDFRIKYVTVGNFMLLPKLSVSGTSLNQAKGSCYGKYKDYADLFFMELFKDKEDSGLQGLKDVNNFYFKEIDSKKFCEINYLKDYFDFKNSKFKEVFLHVKDGNKYYPYYWWQFKNKSEKEKDYRNFAEDYIDEANKIIKYRADEICKKLEKRLKP